MAKKIQMTLRIDEETAIALRRLAAFEARSQNAQLSLMIRNAAKQAGLWTPIKSDPRLRSVAK